MRLTPLRLLSVAAIALVTSSCSDADPTNPTDGPLGVRWVTITPRADTIFVADTTGPTDTARVVGTAFGMGGAVLPVEIRYVSTNPAVATVDENGFVTAHSIGSTIIKAQAGGEEETATITVQRRTYSIFVTPGILNGVVGDTVRVSAVARDPEGRPVPGVTISFESSDPSIASVDQEGLVTFVAAGSVTISARDAGSTPAGTSAITSFARELLSVDVGSDQACGVVALNRGHCWGHGGFGELGTPSDSVCVEESDTLRITATCQLSPKRITTTAFTAVTAGEFFSCGLSGERRAYCWGLGEAGRIGNGRLDEVGVPTLVTSGLSFASISAGRAHACAIATSSVAYCWGSDSSQQLGDYTRRDMSTTPIPVIDGSQSPVLLDSISAGGNHTCGLRGGTVFCWGSNSAGQLGHAGLTDRPNPVVGLSVKQVSAGLAHTCALAVDGRAFCWGNNASGQLGNGGVGSANSVPVQVTGGHVFLAIAAGNAHTCGVTLGGDAYCWGSNEFEQSGGLNRQPSGVPRAVPGGLKFSAISAGSRTTCAVASSGGSGVYCWGSNIYGALGNSLQAATRGTPMPATVPQ